MIDQVVDTAQSQNKNILIIGSARSGTHPLGSEIKQHVDGSVLLGEICKVSDQPRYWEEIQKLYNTPVLTIGQLVQLDPKIKLSSKVEDIKKHTVVVNIRRKDKVKQFASWIYFRVLDPTWVYRWHNHSADQTRHEPGSIEATPQQLEQFVLEQMVDDFFLPDFCFCYEDMVFSNENKYFKNQFSFPIELIFSNLDFVKEYLENWHYAQQHFRNQ